MSKTDGHGDGERERERLYTVRGFKYRAARTREF